MRNVSWFIFSLAVPMSLSLVSPAGSAVGVCGVPVGDDAPPTATDALFVLQAAVGLHTCNICVCDVDSSGETNTTDALRTLQVSVGINVSVDCPECDSDGLACPSVAQFALFARIRAGVCTTNADCAAFSSCDTSIGRCRTRTDSDNGWTGLAHDTDLNDPVPARLFLGCVGPAPCGQCEITGHDPSLGNCRCANDNRQKCFTVAGPDEENCGGEQCICNFGPPLPISAGSTPVCVLNTLASQPEGTANIDDGTGSVEIHLAEKVFLGISRLTPCPLCVNDPMPADGVRGGVCVGGQNDTMDCDAQAYNATFPPPTGALYSLDCFPLEGANVTGSGLRLDTALKTGRSELHAIVPCADDGPFAQLDCPCRVCSGDNLIPCNTDAECAAEGAGTCSSNGLGTQTIPNDCTDAVCESAGAFDEGRCATGPDDLWCDGLIRPDGAGLFGCFANADCEAGTLGVDAGACTLVTRRDCFLDPIVSVGDPHPVIPFVGGTFCLPATTASSVNNAAGFPGPGRLRIQTLVSTFCKSDPATQYQPGVGGCPAAP